MAQSIAAFALGVASAGGALWVFPKLRLSITAVSKRSSPARQCADTLPRVSGSSPQSGWLPGQPQPHPYQGSPLMQLDPEKLDAASIYALGISAVVPRPIAFISTLGADGSSNLSPFSYFNIMHHNPCVVTVGVSHSPQRGGDQKDTHRNILETGECVISIISEWFVEAANHTCGDFARGVDEKAVSGLTPLPSVKVKPAGVAESLVNMECKLLHHYDMKDKKTGKQNGAVLLLEVVLFRVVEAATLRTPSGKVVMDPVKLRPVARLGGHTYGRVAGMFDIQRPDGQGRYPPKDTPRF